MAPVTKAKKDVTPKIRGYARDAVKLPKEVADADKRIVKGGDTVTKFAREDLGFTQKAELTRKQQEQVNKRVKAYADLNNTLDINELVSGDQLRRPPLPKAGWNPSENVLTALTEAPEAADTKKTKKKKAPPAEEGVFAGMKKTIQKFFEPKSEAPAKPGAGKAAKSTKPAVAPKDAKPNRDVAAKAKAEEVPPEFLAP